MRAGLSATMRRVILTGSGFVLLAALCVLWACRFERVTGLPTWRLAEVRAAAPPMAGVEWTGTADQPRLLLRVHPGQPQVAARFAIPRAPAVDGLHLRFRMASRGLVPGGQTWEDGRFMIEWHPQDGGTELGTDYLSSIRLDEPGVPQDFVILSGHGPAVPALRLEHLGRSGEFEIADLEITPIRERLLWKIGKWLLALGWLAWFLAFIHCWPGIPWWRAVAASLICLLMGIHFVIPGPWKIQRAIYPEFLIGAEPHTLGEIHAPAIVRSGPLPALGELQNQGGWALRVKLRISEARTLLHALLLFAPSLLLVGLLGRRPALLLMIAMALAIESAQIAFGYGFDRTDLMDLLCDAIGILLALWLEPKIRRWWRLRFANA